MTTRLCHSCRQRFEKSISYERLSRVKATLYDIARWRVGHMQPPKQVFERVCEDFKQSPIWPRYSDPEPDYFTGEVLYRPKHTNDLTDKECTGVMNWLQEYMDSRGIPSHAGDNWRVPGEAA